MTKPITDGYVFRQQVGRIRQAVSSNRESLRRLNDENPGPQTRSMLIAKAAMALSEIQEAVVELEKIGTTLRKAQAQARPAQAKNVALEGGVRKTTDEKSE